MKGLGPRNEPRGVKIQKYGGGSFRRPGRTRYNYPSSVLVSGTQKRSSACKVVPLDLKRSPLHAIRTDLKRSPPMACHFIIFISVSFFLGGFVYGLYFQPYEEKPLQQHDMSDEIFGQCRRAKEAFVFHHVSKIYTCLFRGLAFLLTSNLGGIFHKM